MNTMNYEIDKNKKYIVNIDIENITKEELRKLIIKMKEAFDKVDLGKNIVGYIPTKGNVDAITINNNAVKTLDCFGKLYVKEKMQ